MAIDIEQVRQWWDALAEDQRGVLRAGNEQFPMETAATKLLFDTDCPALPTDMKWDDLTDGFSLGMPAEVAEVINTE